MVSASASGKKKKKVKKSGKRKPVNLQANFNRKCALVGNRPGAGASADATAVSPVATYEALSDAMFPSNDHHHDDASAVVHAHNDAHAPDAGDAACGDFHLHSVCSDGKFKPSEVIARAAANGVTYMSLTDHDTMAGVAEAIAAAQKLGVVVFPGVEISAEVKGGENLHILGYFYPGSNSVELEKQLLKIRTGRHKRGKGMLEKLEAMGIKLEWERVLEIAGEAAPGRPHVAEALVEAGHVANFRQAFSRYLHNDGPAYVELGGSDFHGIDPTTERAPGAIPFPRQHIDRFLAHALKVWERPLVERLHAMAEAATVADSDAATTEELLIWKEQEPLVRQTLADLGVEMQIIKTEAAAAVDRNSEENSSASADPIEGHYRTIRVIAPSGAK
ncbi:hypothetical protein BBJ28_00009542 [Nothophytophthora sp. Chile5]|nr:hypothetical protein BBJ28_00009542 [Nothophytophthora sp. Chile5]